MTSTTVEFLTETEVLTIHQDQVARYGGSEGLRDVALLQSALAVPQATFGGEFLHKDVCEMASAYLFHLVQNHPFVDGNKRVGAVAAFVFSALNDIRLTAPPDVYEQVVLSVAAGTMSKPELAGFFHSHCNNTGVSPEGDK
jgi:death-on-curing protein